MDADQTQYFIKQIKNLEWFSKLKIILLIGLILTFLILAILSDIEKDVLKDNVLKDDGVNSNTKSMFVKRSFNGTIMVKVPAGSFEMGSEDGDLDEKPVNTQYFTKPFWIDETEVTRAAYQFCVTEGKCTAAVEGPNRFSDIDKQPINYVTWYQASEYCKWRRARLPTEMEWEYAARGPNNLVYPWGNEFNKEILNYSGSIGRKTIAVNSYLDGASWVGALNMSGNVWEWTSSSFRNYPYDVKDGREVTRDTSNNEYVVLRGGSFNDTPSRTRSAYRIKFKVEDSNYSLGFRCAR